MSGILLFIVALIYLFVGWAYWRKGEHGMALAFIAYALANVGFIIAGYEVK